MEEKKSFVARRWWVFLLVGILVGSILGLMVAAVITWVMPKQYESTAVVYWGEGFSDRGRVESRQYFATQFEVITAAKTLAPVVEELDLGNRWGIRQEEVIGILKESIKVTQRTGTDLIEIRVRSVDADLARKIASAVASSYQNRRNADDRGRVEAKLQALDDKVEEQKDLVEKKRKVLDEIVRTTGKPYFEERGEKPASDDEISGNFVDRESLASEVAEYRGATEDYESALALLQELKLKHSTVRVGMRAPSGLITIHEDPKIAERPVSPNVSMNLILGLVGGGLGGGLMSVLLLLFFGLLSNGRSKRAS